MDPVKADQHVESMRNKRSASVKKFRQRRSPVNAHRTPDSSDEQERVLNSLEFRTWFTLQEQRKLFAKFPLFFRSVHFPASYPSNLALLGIQCGVGWFPIIEEAAKRIEQELETEWSRQARLPENIASLDYEIRKDTGMNIGFPIMSFCSEIRQVGGGLDMTMVGGYLCHPHTSKRIRGFIENAGLRARTVCERCGERGKFREGYWEHVYCDDCVAPKPPPDPFDMAATK
jgi:hypothetical protein